MSIMLNVLQNMWVHNTCVFYNVSGSYHKVLEVVCSITVGK